MDIGDVNLRLDRRWDMQELATLSRLYVQCYSLIYSLSGVKIDSVDKRAIDWFTGIYATYPWRGGYSAINFYHSLYWKVPYDDRPVIQEIHYGSPGRITLKEAVLVAGMLAGIVAAVTSSIDDVHDTYNRIQNGMSQRRLTKLEVQLKELQLDQARLDFVLKAKKELISKMEIPAKIQSELARRSAGNELMELKILMSVFRRVEPLATLQGEGKLKLDAPNEEKSNLAATEDGKKTRRH